MFSIHVLCHLYFWFLKTVKMMVQRADFEQNLKNICPATVKEKTRGKYCVLFYQFAIICRLLIMILISNHLQKKLLILGICFPSISINVIWSAISCILSTFVTVRLALVFAAALEKEYFFSNRRLCFLYREFFHRYEMNSLWFFFIIETRLKIPFIVRIGRLTVCQEWSAISCTSFHFRFSKTYTCFCCHIGKRIFFCK